MRHFRKHYIDLTCLLNLYLKCPWRHEYRHAQRAFVYKTVVSKTYVTSVLLVRISYLIGVSIVIVNVVTKALSVAASTL